MQQALCDDSPAVRTAAGAAFNQLFRGTGGSDASAEIVPALLESLEGDLNALEGLKQVLKAQPRLLASVLPRLAAPPLTAFTAHTLGALAEVSGPALPPHLSLLMPPLLQACCSEVCVAAASAAPRGHALKRIQPPPAGRRGCERRARCGGDHRVCDAGGGRQ